MWLLPYLLIRNKLQTITALKEVGWDVGQGTSKYKGGLRCSPAAFIKFLPAQTSTLGDKIQEAEVQFTIRLVQDIVSDDKGLLDNSIVNEHMDLGNVIFSALQGFRGKLSDIPGQESKVNTSDDFQVLNSINRTSIETSQTPDSITVTTQTFKVYLKDYAAAIRWTKAEDIGLNILELKMILPE